MRLVTQKRRGLSEVIATLLLLAITTASSAFLASLMNGGGFDGLGASTTAPVSPTYSVQLTGYDTRDSTRLLQIDTLDNRFDGALCTVSCEATADSIPADGGTDFITIQIKNAGTSPIYIRNIQVNGVTHEWDAITWDQPLDAGPGSIPGGYPQSGKYSILPVSSLVQKSSNQMFGDQEMRLVIKLSSGMEPDVALQKPLHILLDFGGTRSAEFVIMSGEAK